MTEWLHFHFPLSCIREGNGNPLQCSCLENPRDGGASWAAIYGVAQSWTRLKWHSSSRTTCLLCLTKLFFIYWTLTALQCCVGFCCTTKGISSMYTCISPSSWASLPPPPTPAPLGHPRAQGWASCATEQLPALYFTSILHRKVKVIQLCPTLCDHRNYTVHGILQARILEWIVFPFSRGSSQPRNWTQVSRISGGLFTSWAIVEAQEHWSG